MTALTLFPPGIGVWQPHLKAALTPPPATDPASSYFLPSAAYFSRLTWVLRFSGGILFNLKLLAQLIAGDMANICLSSAGT